MSLLGKPPLPHKTQKNNTVFHGRRDHADEIALLKRHITLMPELFYLAFYFFRTYVYILRPNSKIRCRNRRER